MLKNADNTRLPVAPSSAVSGEMQKRYGGSESERYMTVLLLPASLAKRGMCGLSPHLPDFIPTNHRKKWIGY